jgi:hypothetical protein
LASAQISAYHYGVQRLRWSLVFTQSSLEHPIRISSKNASEIYPLPVPPELLCGKSRLSFSFCCGAHVSCRFIRVPPQRSAISIGGLIPGEETKSHAFAGRVGEHSPIRSEASKCSIIYQYLKHDNEHKSMAELQPRYEYRVWADTLEDVRDNLQRLATPLRTETSEETYLISATTDKCNAKIRGGRINLKALLATERKLELWKPVLDAEFPLDRSVISGQIFPCLELRAPDLHRRRYSMDEFVSELIRAQPQIEIVRILKRRARFLLDECLAEFTSVSIGKVARETVAVESVEPGPVLRVIRQLHIAGMANANYIAELKQVLSDGTNVAVSSMTERQNPRRERP